jgi:hypothetical protein
MISSKETTRYPAGMMGSLHVAFQVVLVRKILRRTMTNKSFDRILILLALGPLSSVSGIAATCILLNDGGKHV